MSEKRPGTAAQTPRALNKSSKLPQEELLASTNDTIVDGNPVPYPTKTSLTRPPSVTETQGETVPSRIGVTSSPDRWRGRFGLGDMILTGDNRSRKQSEAVSRSRLAGWWNGTAGAEDSSPQTSPRPDSSAAPTESTPTKLRRAETVGGDLFTQKNTASSSSSRFGFLATGMSALSKLAQQDASTSQEDELCDLKIDNALFPHMSPSDRDAFSPAAFKNLQTTATGLLQRFQIAYREQSTALRDLGREREAQADELEEVETRAKHLKMQLEDMAKKAEERELVMLQLMDELTAEKKAAAQARMLGEKSPLTPEGSTVSEDLGVETDQRLRGWRKSGGSGERSEGGFETDEESYEDGSLFSRSRSPTIAPSVFEGSVTDGPTSHAKATNTTTDPRKRPRSSQQMSTFQKLIKNISGDIGKEDADADNRQTAGCSNCQGQNASVAWDTVSLLRDENKGLKHRVAELETAMESALDIVNGIAL